ncbi:MAG: A24 family peptidase [Burkholderiaceae bacterium]|nr:A24 family peptidase [Burkholderiaceae bacterium]
MLVSPLFDTGLAGLAGLLLGSFLNVVIHRLPRMLERQWAEECAELTGAANATAASAEPFNLIRPASRCPKCGHAIRWHENIPVLSYLFLRGRCSACDASIGLRYPLVELATGALFAFTAWRWGWTPPALMWCGFSAALLTLALIDWDTTLLPDDITLPLLWAGLLAAALRWTPTPLSQAVWGAALGYLSLWLIYWLFKLLTGKEGMGYGDFKLFGALGAWFGMTALPAIVLMASVIGAIVGIALRLRGGLREGGYIPFGPFLAGAGLVSMIFGPQAVLRWIGL